MPKKLTNEIVDARLENRNIKRIGDYIDSKTKIEFQCLDKNCLNIWEARPNNIVNNRNNCPKCYGNERLTNEIIDVKLKNRNIRRIGNYTNNKTKIEFQCINSDCFNIWEATPGSIINSGSGCPKCVIKKIKNKITNEIIDKRLKNRNIKRIGNYIDSKSKIEFQCLEDNCLNIWKSTPNSVTNSGTGCPKCVKLTNKIIDKRLKDRSIKRIGEYVNNHTKIEFQCLESNCLNVWKAMPRNAVNNESGCPKCTDKKLTNEIIDARLENRNIKRIGEYVNNKTKIEFQCLESNCLNIWMAAPCRITNTGSSCPVCKNTNEKLILNILKENNIIFNHQKSFKDFCSTEKKRYRFDFYLPVQNIIIEYNGGQHYFPVKFGNISQNEANNKFKKQQLRDEYGRQFCKNNNLKLIEIDGRIYKNNKLKKYILELIKNNFSIT